MIRSREYSRGRPERAWPRDFASALFEAEAELAERKAAADELVNLAHVNPEAITDTTNKMAAPSADKLAEYRRVVNHLDSLYKKEQDDSFTFTPESAWMNALHKQITNNASLKAQLEKENPALIAVGVSESKRAEVGANPKVDFAAETARVSALNSKITVLNGQLDRLQKEAATVSDAESTITKLQLQKEVG